MRLPVAGALMPDAYQGYGLPIRGVLATWNTVIPYRLGVDIGCRMHMSVYDLPSSFLEGNRELLKIKCCSTSPASAWPPLSSQKTTLCRTARS